MVWACDDERGNGSSKSGYECEKEETKKSQERKTKIKKAGQISRLRAAGVRIIYAYS